MLDDNHIGYWVLAILAKILVPAIGNITKCSYIKTLMLRKLAVKLTYYDWKVEKLNKLVYRIGCQYPQTLLVIEISDHCITNAYQDCEHIIRSMELIVLVLTACIALYHLLLSLYKLPLTEQWLPASLPVFHVYLVTVRSVQDHPVLTITSARPPKRQFLNNVSQLTTYKWLKGIGAAEQVRQTQRLPDQCLLYSTAENPVDVISEILNFTTSA